MQSVHYPSRVAFCIIPRGTCFGEGSCLLNRTDITTLFNFTHLPPKNSYHHLFQVTPPGEYSLYFTNCQPSSRVTVRATIKTHNLNGRHKNYLPVDQTQLPILYLVFAACYFVFFTFWVDVSLANKKTHFCTHFSMRGLLVMKALCLIFAAVEKQCFNLSGASHGWDVVFFACQLSRVILLCIVIALISFRSSIVTPRAGQITLTIILILSLLAQFIPEAAGTNIENQLYMKNQENCFWYLWICHQLPYIAATIVFAWPFYLGELLRGQRRSSNFSRFRPWWFHLGLWYLWRWKP